MEKQFTSIQASLGDKYPGSEMTIKAINEMGVKMEKIILEGLPETKLFSDAEIVMLQFVGAMICGSLKDHTAIRRHISFFGNSLIGFANNWIKLDKQAKAKSIQLPKLTKE